MNYYNEWDAGAAAWLRELIKAGHIPPGYVDERSITEVTPSDLEGFTQCHFFAGIGGWSYALQLAGIPASAKLWTGSPPCQPFSVAGKQLGQLDDRHLAPTFMRLVAQCKPAILFGEQVAAAIGKHWLDDLFTELEAEGYACGAAVLPACSVGAPHKRDRLFFGANLLADSRYDTSSGEAKSSSNERKEANRSSNQPGGCGIPSRSMADTRSERERQDWMSGKSDGRLLAGREKASAAHAGLCVDSRTDPHHGFWSDADWLGCRDGKFRPVEPGTFPLAHGVPARVGRLRGYGNAIVPPVAAEFVIGFRAAIADQEGPNRGR